MAASGKKFVPSDAVKFAQKMGIDLTGLEPEAAEIWTHLEKLSSGDPLEYERFVSQQMQNAKEEDESKTGKNGKDRSFRPDVGYCFKVTTSGGDGLMVRELSAKKTLSVNMCSSKVIEAPIDSSGAKVRGDLWKVDGPQVPLLVGPVRPIPDGKGNAVDVVMHPMVLEAAQRPSFRSQLDQLALTWIAEETALSLDPASVEDADRKYIGGLGDDGAIPVLFHVTAAMLEGQGQGQGQGTKGKQTSALASTSSLLDRIKSSGSSEPPAVGVKLPTAPSQEPQAAASKPKITVVSPVPAPVPVPVPAPVPVVKQQAKTKKEPLPSANSSSASQASSAKPSQREYEQLQDLLERSEGLHEDRQGILGQTAGGAGGGDNLLSGLASIYSKANPLNPLPAYTPPAPAPIDLSPGPCSDFTVRNQHPSICQLTLHRQEGGVVIRLNGLRGKADGIDVDVSAKEVRISYDLSAFASAPASSSSEGCKEVLLVRYTGAEQLVFSPARIKAKLLRRQGQLDITADLIAG